MGNRIDRIAVDLLKSLRDSPERFFAIPELAEQFSSRPKVINEALRGLAVWGYRFRFDQGSKVRFVSAPDSIFPHEIEHHLETKLIGSRIVSHFSLPSTNTQVASREKSTHFATVFF